MLARKDMECCDAINEARWTLGGLSSRFDAAAHESDSESLAEI